MRSTDECSKIWRNDALPGASFFRAAFVDHVYKPHTHEEYAFGFVERGVQTFYCRGAQRISPPDGIFLINADDVHDGQSYDPLGYAYCMMYVDPEALHEATGCRPLFREPLVIDSVLATQFRHLHRVSESAPCDVEVQSLFLQVVQGLVDHYASESTQSHVGSDDVRVRQAIAYMQANLDQRLSLAEIAEHVDLSRFYFLRLFRKATGLPPHSYLNDLRLRKAKALIADRVPLSQVAVHAGFYDQAHLTNRFVQTFGVTPGAYAHSTR